MTGKMSITADIEDNQLEIIVENEDGNYTKHFVGLSDNVTYTVEDLNLGANDVEKYKYTLNFNPDMWLPYEVETIDQRIDYYVAMRGITATHSISKCL